MALHRGIQSAIFYYLSCAPCTELSNRKKRRKEATLDRVHRRALEMEQPGLYRHPSPFATNPHWQTEIDLGPSPANARRKKDNKKKATKVRSSAENASTVASNTSLPPSKDGEFNDSTWNLQAYQREDECLSGFNRANSRTSGLEGSVVTSKDGLSRPPTARTVRTEKTSTSYYSANNPPINDMHPAIVTRMEDRDAAAWMMLPPPTARVMSGRERPHPGRGRSDSGSSRVSSRMGTNPPLSRQISHRIIDEKLKSRELLPAISLSRESSTRSPNGPQGQRHDRRSPPTKSTEYLSCEDAVRPQRRHRPPPIHISEDSYDSDKTVVYRTPNEDLPSDGSSNPDRLLLPADPGNDRSRRSRRSRRGTSTSSSRASSSQRDPSTTRRPTSCRPALAGSRDRDKPDSSLNVLQELAPAALVNMRHPTKQPSFETRIELPAAAAAADSADEMELLGSRKAAFESWYDARDYDQFSQWVSERTRRDVSARWSVDF